MSDWRDTYLGTLILTWMLSELIIYIFTKNKYCYSIFLHMQALYSMCAIIGSLNCKYMHITNTWITNAHAMAFLYRKILYIKHINRHWFKLLISFVCIFTYAHILYIHSSKSIYSQVISVLINFDWQLIGGKNEKEQTAIWQRRKKKNKTVKKAKLSYQTCCKYCSIVCTCVCIMI